MGRFRDWSELCKAFNSESRLGVCWSVLCISHQMISFDAWIIRRRRGFCWLHGLSKTNLVKTAFLSIRFMHPLLYLIRETSISRGAADRDRRQENSEEVSDFFLSKCSLPSLVNSQFEREIWEGNFGRTQFLSKSCCEQTHWFGIPIV